MFPLSALPLSDPDSDNFENDELDHEDTVEDEIVSVTVEDLLEILTHGVMTEDGLLPYSSNYSFLVTLSAAETTIPAVYKPRRGENPLWDFPTGTLCQRETAAYLVSEWLGWDLVPPTVLREGTRGTGSVQFFVHSDPEEHYFTMSADARYALAFRQLSLFDYAINNADRKSGHCLFGFDQRLWAIDHGICFHHDYKLRTVIWEFSGEPIEETLLDDLVRLQRELDDEMNELTRSLSSLLHRREMEAFCHRVGSLVQTKRYPQPPRHQRNYPWPPV